MAEPEISINGVKKPTRTGQGQTEPKNPVSGSGRPQSEMSREQKEGYSQHTLQTSNIVTADVRGAQTSAVADA